MHNFNRTDALTTLYVCDVDGCLNLGPQHEFDSGGLSRIDDYLKNSSRKKTGGFTLISGRPHYFLKKYVKHLSVELPCICENGAIAYFPKKNRIETIDGISTDIMFSVKSLRAQLQNQIDEGLPAKFVPGKEICISLNPSRSFDNIAPKIGELFESVIKNVDKSIFEVTHSANAVDITPLGVNKGTGLQWLSEIVGVDHKDMIGIGDSEGDLPFLKMVGQSGAPANASKIVKKHVQYISNRKYVEGTLDVIRHFDRVTRG